jgi:predicted RNA-binding protein with RPS1 domain
MTQRITRDMLATALQRLEAVEANEPEVVDSERFQQRAEEVADVALKAIALCVKYVLGTHGRSSVDGLGTFVLQNGGIQFVPESDVLQYALLHEQDEGNIQQGLRDAFIQHLTLAQGILPLIDLTQGQSIRGSVDVSAEQRLLQSIFGESGAFHFGKAASKLIGTLVHSLRLAGVKIESPSDLAMTQGEILSAGAATFAPHDLKKPSDAAQEVEVGKTYLGTVSRLADFGAFVEILPGTDGLLHISEMAEHRIMDVRDELKEGDQVLVKVLAVERNRIRLSRRAVLKEQRTRMTSATHERSVEAERVLEMDVAEMDADTASEGDS